ncbi:hypothetical protein SCUCBS95973_002334 [Sporothrix curviconia]|uniref:Protein kinase domain-containing protein n=1 Tax=Sporothrix curviconia TaxID=1260050 RepID=A0ABP0B624_9PEZI
MSVEIRTFNQPWEPLDDPDKPELPYRPGCCLSIRRHLPPPPFGKRYTGEEPARFDDDWKVRRHMKLTDWALQTPPRNGSPPHPDPTVHGLQILDALACKDGRGAQVVRCHLEADPERICVAKIYDPFYYNHLEYDVTWTADHDYSREAAAYEVLRDAKVDGKIVPKYYGSWTFDLPVPEVLRESSGVTSTTRPVCMILIEWIAGISLDKIVYDERAVKSIPPALRLEILARGMENFCTLESCGVRHNDWAPRNVVVSPASGWETNLPAVFIIDFNIADVTKSPYCKIGDYVHPPLPPNPRYRFWCEWMPRFGMWIPRQYQDGHTFNGWLATRWAKEEKGFSNPPQREKDFKDSPKYYEFVTLEPDSPIRTRWSGRPYPDGSGGSYPESDY